MKQVEGSISHPIMRLIKIIHTIIDQHHNQIDLAMSVCSCERCDLGNY